MREIAHPLVLFPVAMYMALNAIGQIVYVTTGGASILIEKTSCRACNSEKMAYSMCVAERKDFHHLTSKGDLG